MARRSEYDQRPTLCKRCSDMVCQCPNVKAQHGPGKC